MGGFFTAVIAVAVILGFMILIHEFGHYVAAKLLGVRVEQFAIGFGKRLVGFRRGDTDYRINALPLGGYVKMSGDNPMDERTGDPAEFLSHPRWHRFLIAIAGPGHEYPAGHWAAYRGVHGALRVSRGIRRACRDRLGGAGYAAAKAGIQAGDHIVRIENIDNPTWDQVCPKRR